MSELPHQTPGLTAGDATQDGQLGDLTRRTVIAGAAAATAVAAVDAPAHAQDVVADARTSMVLFVLLSGALTGIAESKLAPGFDLQKSIPGSDPINIKQEYFDWISRKRPIIFRTLLQIVREIAAQALTPPARAQAIIDKVQEKPEIKYLARSIVLMWYLGAWYDPDNLRALAELPQPPAKASAFDVISPKAYTQAWALRVAQAHPMGFSQMQFGYWTHPAQPVDSFIGTNLS
jgi:hypothetical protein